MEIIFPETIQSTKIPVNLIFAICSTRHNFDYNVWSIKIRTIHKLPLWLYYDIFWQILISYFKFLMPRPLKWSILGAHTIILSKNIHKVTKTDYVWFKFLWIRRYTVDYRHVQTFYLTNSINFNAEFQTLIKSLFRPRWNKTSLFLVSSNVLGKATHKMEELIQKSTLTHFYFRIF